MATAMSAPVLLHEVTKMCPPDTPIPSLMGCVYSSGPNIPQREVQSSILANFVSNIWFNQGNFVQHIPIAIMLQHHNIFYCYQHTFAVHYRDYTHYVCLDDNCITARQENRGLPVAAVDRGKRVIVSMDKKFNSVFSGK